MKCADCGHFRGGLCCVAGEETSYLRVPEEREACRFFEHRHLILAMREKWLRLLLTGEKTAEVRRTSPRAEVWPGTRLYLYHKGAIWGYVTVTRAERVCAGNSAKLHSQVCVYFRRACLGFMEMMEYLDKCVSGRVYVVTDPVRFAEPVPVPCRPQGWQYMTAAVMQAVAAGRKEEI